MKVYFFGKNKRKWKYVYGFTYTLCGNPAICGYLSLYLPNPTIALNEFHTVYCIFSAFLSFSIFKVSQFNHLHINELFQICRSTSKNAHVIDLSIFKSNLRELLIRQNRSIHLPKKTNSERRCIVYCRSRHKSLFFQLSSGPKLSTFQYG